MNEELLNQIIFLWFLWLVCRICPHRMLCALCNSCCGLKPSTGRLPGVFGGLSGVISQACSSVVTEIAELVTLSWRSSKADCRPKSVVQKVKKGIVRSNRTSTTFHFSAGLQTFLLTFTRDSPTKTFGMSGIGLRSVVDVEQPVQSAPCTNSHQYGKMCWNLCLYMSVRSKRILCFMLPYPCYTVFKSKNRLWSSICEQTLTWIQSPTTRCIVVSTTLSVDCSNWGQRVPQEAVGTGLQPCRQSALDGTCNACVQRVYCRSFCCHAFSETNDNNDYRFERIRIYLRAQSCKRTICSSTGYFLEDNLYKGIKVLEVQRMRHAEWRDSTWFNMVQHGSTTPASSKNPDYLGRWTW